MGVWMLIRHQGLAMPVRVWLPVQRWRTLLAEARHRMMAAERGS